MKKTGIFMIFLLCLFAAEVVKTEEIQENLQENLLRLHIIANSNSSYDQQIKLDIRDKLLDLGSYDKDKLYKTANDELLKLDADYGAEVTYKKRYVPKKEYKNIALPEGVYTCLDVVLGRGAGENWWCIAYPPLCFTEAVVGEMSSDAKKQLAARLSEESLSTILKNENVTYKFKIVEDFQKIKKYLY